MYTNVRVSVETAQELKELKDKLGLNSIDEVIKVLLKVYKKAALSSIFGIDQERSSEEDRSESSPRRCFLDRDLQRIRSRKKGSLPSRRS